LVVIKDVPFSKLAELFDKVIERKSGLQVSEVNTRAESKQSDFSDVK